MRERKSPLTGAAPAGDAGAKKASAAPASPTTGAVAGIRRPAPYAAEYDFVDSLYQPHTITAGVVLLSALLFVWYSYHLENDLIGSVKLGLFAATWTFIVFGAVHFPDGLMTRPHPAFWRAVLAAAVIYFIWTIFLLFQDLSTVKLIAGLYDPRLKEEMPEQSYAEDCRLSTPDDPWKFYNTITDVFLLAHAAGYMAKALVLRDWRLVTAVSIGFELLEVSLQHVLPNFKECWWDHLIADVILCNGGGTLLGMWILRLIRAKKYDWVKVSDIRSLSGKAGRILRQLGPRQFDAVEWGVFQSPKRLAQVLFLLTVMFVQELNCFYLKNMLNMKPTYHLVILRLVGWGFFALTGLREFYVYIADPQCKRLGTMAWVGAMTLVAETTLIVKMAREGGYFQQPTPSYIGIPWILATTFFAVWALLFFGVPRLRRYFVTRMLLRLLFWAGPLVLMAMCLMGNVDLEYGKAEFETFVAQHNLW